MASKLAAAHRDAAKELKVGDQVSVEVGGATCPSAVVVEFVHGEVLNATDGAVQVGNDRGSVWLPRAALVVVVRDYGPGDLDVSFRLAKWFEPDQRKCRALDQMTDVSGVSNAY